jgi:hypothetical protein
VFSALRSAAAAGLLLYTQSASAEHIYSLWRLEPTTALPHTATLNRPFLTIRTIPIHSVKTTSASEFAALPAGTVLYLVFNDDGQIAYCPRPDESQVRRSWLSGFATKRPCLFDSDRDGQFDKSFTAFDVTGPGLTRTRGSIQSSVPLSTKVGYINASRLDEEKMTKTYDLVLSGKALDKARLELKTGSVDVASGKQVARLPMPSYTFLNYSVQMQSVNGPEAEITVTHNPDLFASSDDRAIYARRLPDWLIEYLTRRANDVPVSR